jgi:hypothetical protein
MTGGAAEVLIWQGGTQMELIVERILEDDDRSLELFLQLLWLLWCLTKVWSCVDSTRA